jgi:hypothetical protein
MADVSGKTFPTLTRELVLNKAGMAESTYENPLPAKLSGIVATGHRRRVRRFRAGNPHIRRWRRGAVDHGF